MLEKIERFQSVFVIEIPERSPVPFELQHHSGRGVIQHFVMIDNLFVWKGEQVMPVERSFHICRAHAAARKVLRQGYLPAGFTCPLGDSDCPMRAILLYAGGKSVVIHARFKDSIGIAAQPESA